MYLFGRMTRNTINHHFEVPVYPSLNAKAIHIMHMENFLDISLKCNDLPVPLNCVGPIYILKASAVKDSDEFTLSVHCPISRKTLYMAQKRYISKETAIKDGARLLDPLDEFDSAFPVFKECQIGNDTETKKHTLVFGCVSAELTFESVVTMRNINVSLQRSNGTSIIGAGAAYILQARETAAGDWTTNVLCGMTGSVVQSFDAVYPDGTEAMEKLIHGFKRSLSLSVAGLYSN